MRALIAAFLLAMAGPSLAAEIVMTDGDTFQLDRTIFRLDGIDAPEIDQTCLDQSGDVWPCGVAARDRLSAYIGSRAVRCEDKGPDPVYKHRRIGICSIESEATTLNEWLVREGWAIKFEPSAKGRFAAEEADARENRRGLWKVFRRTARAATMESQWSAALSAVAVKLAPPSHWMPLLCSSNGSINFNSPATIRRGTQLFKDAGSDEIAAMLGRAPISPMSHPTHDLTLSTSPRSTSPRRSMLS